MEQQVDELDIFRKRLDKIGIHCTFAGNYPWIYLDTVNGKKVKGKYNGNHGFTIAWLTLKKSNPISVKIYRQDIGPIFAKIRKTLKKIEEDKWMLKKFVEQTKDRLHNLWIDPAQNLEIQNILDDVLNNFYK